MTNNDLKSVLKLQFLIYFFLKSEKPLKSGDEKRSRLLEIIRKIDIDEDDDLDESELVQERFNKMIYLICELDASFYWAYQAP